MKKAVYAAGILCLLFFMLRYPAEALSASKEGLSLWLNVLLPSLLPFLILTDVLIQTGFVARILSPARILWRYLFGISPAGAYALVLGLLCGYPMGAKTASDLYKNNEISRREAQYLLTFTNYPGPAFVSSYLVHICLKNKVSPVMVFTAVLLSGYLTMLFFRFVIYKNQTGIQKIIPAHGQKKKVPETAPAGALLDTSIMDGFETITRLGGYILLFSLLSSLLRHFIPLNGITGIWISGLLELTTGLYRLSESTLPLRIKYMSAVSFAAFGGICITAQTRSLVHRDLSVIPYAAAKLIHLGLASAIAFLLSMPVSSGIMSF